MPQHPVFYDPHQRRHRWLRRTGAVVAALASLAIAAAVAAVVINPALPALGLPTADNLPQPHHLLPPAPERPVGASRHRYRLSRTALSEVTDAQSRVKVRPVRVGQRTELIGFFVNWDDTSFTSLQENIGRIDRLIPEWLHMTDPSGEIVLDAPARQREVMAFVRRTRPRLPIVPLVNNFDSEKLRWDGASLGAMLASPAARRRAIDNLLGYVQQNRFAGLSVDFENIPARSHRDLVTFMGELQTRARALGLELSECVPLDDPAFDYKALDAVTDYLVLMAYDQHTEETPPGPVAGQDWFSDAMERRFAELPPSSLVVALGSYGYDWTERRSGVEVSFQDAVRTAGESDGVIRLDEDSLNPTFDYADDKDRRHHVWFLDAITAFNQMREVSVRGPRGYGLWRLGSEDPSIWTAFEQRGALSESVARQLDTLRYGYDVEYEGRGEILRVTSTPRDGVRDVAYDRATGLITNERLRAYPSPYVIERYGAGNPDDRQVALTFDDGPDPAWTPQILDALAREKVPATFFVIGENADAEPRLLQRILHDGHELGNHTFTHPDVSAITRQQLRLEINATERLLESVVGRRSLLFRPPYAEDIEPERPEQVEPLLFTSARGYYTVGMGIDPGDWRNPGTDAIVQNTLDAADRRDGKVVLLHDGGGDRRQTVDALPRIIAGLKQRGYRFVAVSALAGVSRDAVMPPVPAGDRWTLLIADAGFLALGSVTAVLRVLFLIAIVLGLSRLFIVGSLATVQWMRTRRKRRSAAYAVVAVVVPAHNETKVIGRTITALLGSRGQAFEVIVVDDGSTDGTYERVSSEFGEEPRVRVFRKPNGGKASALNFGVRQTDASIIVAIDADTIVDPEAVRRLVAPFRRPSVGAVAGNAKVGNRINLITRWQALEYIVSQNLDRRAFDVLNGITVVPGAIGAWRRELILQAGGFSDDTLAEDADLTMRVLRHGCDIVYEDRAVAWTEAPDTVEGLLRQRFRWVFGTLQAAWKQRDTLFRPRYGALGLVAMPQVLLFQVLLPLVSPFVDLTMAVSLIVAGITRHQHPAEFSADVLERTLFYYGVFVLVDLLAGVLAFALERRENWTLLVWLPLQRFFYRQLMYVVAVRATLAAVKGQLVGWGKLERKATVSSG